MKKYAVIIQPKAAHDIRRAYDWYLEENPVHATVWLDRIEEAILSLDTHPAARPRAPENEAFDPEIRQQLCGAGNRWRVLFTIEGDCVHVLHVRHSARDRWLP